MTEQLLYVANAVDEADNALLPGLFRVFEEDFKVLQHSFCFFFKFRCTFHGPRGS